MNPTLYVKIKDQDFAKVLADLGFFYMKENEVYVFEATDSLLELLHREYSDFNFVVDDKLCF